MRLYISAFRAPTAVGQNSHSEMLAWTAALATLCNSTVNMTLLGASSSMAMQLRCPDQLGCTRVNDSMFSDPD